MIKQLPVGTSYTLTEEVTKGYLSGQSYWEGNLLTTEPVRLDIINEVDSDQTKKGSLSFTKQLVSEEKQDDTLFSFEVTFEGDQSYTYQIDEGPLTLHESGQVIRLKAGQTALFKDLPVGLVYTIKELPTPHYQAEFVQQSGSILSSQSNVLTFINYYEGQPSLQIKKVSEGKESNPDDEFIFTVYINDQALKEKISLKAGETSSPIPLAFGDRWRVVEELTHTDYYQTSITNSIGQVNEKDQQILVTQTNAYVALATQQVTGQKHWIIPKEYEEKQPEKITVYLMNQEKIVETKEVTGPEWSYTFDVPVYDSDGQKIDYHIEEEAIPGFIMTPLERTNDISNTYVSPVSSSPLKLKKEVTGDQPEQVETFIFTKSPGEEVIEIKGNGEAEFPSDLFESAGTYHYTIREQQTGVLGYTYDTAVYERTVIVEEKDNKLEITSDTLTKDGEPYLEETLVFTNTFQRSLDEKQVIKGSKTWEHGSNPLVNQPKSIVVQLLENNQIVQQKQVSESDKWLYEFVVPVYDSLGEKLTYMIKEVPVQGYETEVSGYNLKNTFIESSPSTSEPKDSLTPSKRPGKLLQTNEKRVLWVSFVGLLMIVSVGIYYFRVKRKL